MARSIVAFAFGIASISCSAPPRIVLEAPVGLADAKSWVLAAESKDALQLIAFGTDGPDSPLELALSATTDEVTFTALFFRQSLDVLGLPSGPLSEGRTDRGHTLPPAASTLASTWTLDSGEPSAWGQATASPRVLEYVVKEFDPLSRCRNLVLQDRYDFDSTARVAGGVPVSDDAVLVALTEAGSVTLIGVGSAESIAWNGALITALTDFGTREIWFGTEDGNLFRDGTVTSSLSGELVSKTPAPGPIRAIFDSESGPVVFLQDQIGRFRNGEFVHLDWLYEEEDRPTAEGAERDGELFIASDLRFLRKVRDDEIARVPLPDGTIGNARSLAALPDGRIVVGTDQGQLLFNDGDRWAIRTELVFDGSYGIKSILPTSTGFFLGGEDGRIREYLSGLELFCEEQLAASADAERMVAFGTHLASIPSLPSAGQTSDVTILGEER